MKKRKILPLGISFLALSAIGVSVPFVVTSCALTSNVKTLLNVTKENISSLETAFAKSSVFENLSSNVFNKLVANQTNSIQIKREIVKIIDPDGSKNIWPEMIGSVTSDQEGNIIISPTSGYEFANANANGNIIINVNFSKQESIPEGVNSNDIKISSNTNNNIDGIITIEPLTNVSSTIVIKQTNKEVKEVNIGLPSSIKSLVDNTGSQLVGFGNPDTLKLHWTSVNLDSNFTFNKTTQTIECKNLSKLNAESNYEMVFQVNIQNQEGVDLLDKPLEIKIVYMMLPLMEVKQLEQCFNVTASTNGEYTVTNLKPNITDVTFPDKVIDANGNTHDVVYSDTIYQENFNQIQNAVIGNNFLQKYVQSPQRIGFSYVQKLEFSEGVTEIPSYSFVSSFKLEEIIFPSTLEVINDQAFMSSKLITSINLPKSLKIIGSQAFGYCDKLANVVIEEGSSLNKIYSEAFGGCVSLTNFTFPISIKQLDMNFQPIFMFKGCTALKTIYGSKELGDQFITKFPSNLTRQKPTGNQIQWIDIQ